jgi:poly(3-hydroxyalkanoate) synthetase
MKSHPQPLERISPDRLLSLAGYTPADNREGYDTAVNWKSNLAGTQVKNIFLWQRTLDAVSRNPLMFGPWSGIAVWQKLLLEWFVTLPVKAHVKSSVEKGLPPDVFALENQRTKKSYADLLYRFCGHFMKDGAFDGQKALETSTTAEGKAFLLRWVMLFSQTERAYNSLGLTGLKAMKDLLKALLILITETPLGKEELPFMRKTRDGLAATDFSRYLEEMKTRFENLYGENAFDMIGYSERATGGRIGYSPFQVLEESRLHAACLRYYPLPEGVRPNGRILYMVAPMINKPELFDMDKGKSVVEEMLKQGYAIYMVDNGEPGREDADLGLDFYGKTLHDRFLAIISARHPGQNILTMGYCMGGTLLLPYLARRAEERLAAGKAMDVRKVVLMASPFKFDDGESGHGPMRHVIRSNYDGELMSELFGEVNIPQLMIEMGMQEIQPGVRYNNIYGFYARAFSLEALRDSAPFLYWLTHGTKFPARAHREWIEKIYLANQIYNGTYCLPSENPDLDGKPVDMGVLKKAGVSIFDYRGLRDPISPMGSCVASILWGETSRDNMEATRNGMNRTIEKNIGHIFVVSKNLLADYLEMVTAFFDETASAQTRNT